MKLIPVLDLKSRLVVRGVAGQRADYRPIESVIAADPNPHTVATSFGEHFGFRQVYVADLDAISGSEPDWDVYRSIAGTGLRLIVDAGIEDQDRAQAMVHFQAQSGTIDRIIIGLESIGGPEQLGRVLEVVGPRSAVFSLDMKDGRPLAKHGPWAESSPREIARQAIALGYRQMIILDLGAVGIGKGVTATDLCREIRRDFPDVELISGGGVRDRADLQLLAESGCSAALVSTALHNGSLTRADVHYSNTCLTG